MIKKELFFHKDFSEVHVGARSLGFSARFTPASTVNDAEGHPVIQMALTQCNKQDKVFSKKVARKYLRERQGQTVRVRDVPALLAAADHRAFFGGFVEIDPEYVKRNLWAYEFIIRKMI